MSVLAMEAFHRLRVDRRYRLDSTARLVLYHLCWRHDETKDVAWPSTADMASKLDVHRSAVTSALARLEKARLITREHGRGRGNSTRYKLRFVTAHRADPKSTQPIDWHYKVSGPPDSLKVSGGPDILESKVSGSEDKSVRQRRHKVSGPPDTKDNKDIKTRPPAVAEGAGGRPRTADDVFREMHQQRKLALLAAVEGEGGSNDHAETQEPEAPAGEETQAGNQRLVR